jgi:prepilin-type N-terminal cleavage/methylation domain-containing protein/prepilin-type processing-associated H-X9-DG protein
MRQRRGLTIIELLVVIGLLALIVSIILPSIHRMREQAGRQRCPSNLRQIGQAIQMYANDNKGAFPRTVSDGAGGPPVSYTGSAAANPFLPGGPGPNDVTAVLFLLARTQDIMPEVFICPNVGYARPWDVGVAPVQLVSNFPSRRFLTYSYTNPYASPEVEKAGFKLSYSLTSDFALAADMNPGGAAVTAVSPTAPRTQLAAANSPNHAGDGQNVLYADGHVEFQATPFCGMMRNAAAADATKRFRDNIYTHGAGWGTDPAVGVNGAPVDAEDSVLLPTALDGPKP